MGSGAKSYMRKGFLIYEEMHKYFQHDEEDLGHTGFERYWRPLLKVVYCPSRQHNFDVIQSKDSFLPLLSNSSVFFAINNKQDATGRSGMSPCHRNLRREEQQEDGWLQQHLLQHCEAFCHRVLQFSWRRNITKSLISKESTTELHCGLSNAHKM